jgi:glutamyl/glutaminyl-tRNA synthetase
VYARFDDTNAERSGGIGTEGLLNEIQQVAQIPLSELPPSLETQGLAIQQSHRRGRYLEVLRRLESLGLAREHENAVSIFIPELDRQIFLAGANPARLVTDSLVNVAHVPVDHPRDYVPLLRSDGTPLWHLATVVDDIDLGINLVVRGTDKMNAVAIQERLRWILTKGQQSVAYIFVPRLIEFDREASRVVNLLASGIRSSSLRWYLSEPFCSSSQKRLPETFSELVQVVRRTELMLRDAKFDAQRLAALDRKMSGQLSTTSLKQDLIDHVGQENLSIIDFIAQGWRRPLADQLRLYKDMTSREVSLEQAPPDAALAIEWMTSYLSGICLSPIPYSVRWLITGRTEGPAPDALLSAFPPELLNQRLEAGRKALS